MLKQGIKKDFDRLGQDNGLIVASAPIIVPKNIVLAEKIDDLLNFRQFGHCLSECYGDAEGSSWWAKFVSPTVQGPLRGTEFEYYTVTDEIRAIRDCSAAISQIVLEDNEIDHKNLIVIEKGNGSRTAMVNKTLVQLQAFANAGINTRLYVAREHSPAYRKEAEEIFAEQRPEIVCLAQDVDYNKEDPSLIPANAVARAKLEGLEYEGPRVIFEYGTSRSNIPTTSPDSVPYEELYATFAHDRKVCRDGGILIMASDCNQDKASMEGSFSHPTHAEFSRNIMRRGAKESVLSDDFNLTLVAYSPRWDANRHLLKHALISDRSQSFGVYRAGEGFIDTRMNAGDEYLYSHSFRWPEKVIQDAACSNGFKSLATFWAPKERVAVFVFKAV
jgi:uncharacterized SAM-dependent methyltransferase